jgi:hypothetical protein
LNIENKFGANINVLSSKFFLLRHQNSEKCEAVFNKTASFLSKSATLHKIPLKR